MRVIIRIRDETKAELPVRAAFEFPTVRELATHLEEMLEIHDKLTLSNTHDAQSEES
jgi:hypothetical protein